MSLGAVTAAGQAGGRGFNAGLQGMRGVAILLVLLNHAGVPGFGGGFVGVDVFFVISGYLIGGLLLRELETKGAIDLWAFYARRVRRLLPASALVLIVALFGIRWLYAPQEQDELLSSTRAAALYAVNLWFASRTTDYFGGHTEANPSLHLWSLAVEEQFYLFWPLLMLLAWRLTRGAPRQALAWLVAGLGVTSFVACVWVTRVNFQYAFFLTPFRIWEFAAGMALVVWPRLGTGYSRAALTTMGFAALAVLAAVCLQYDGRMQFPGFWAAFPVLAAAALLVVVRHGRDSVVGCVLEWRWLRWLGDCSYSVYLWHWPVIIGAALLAPQTGPWETLGLLALSIGLGRLSYRTVEQPFMHSLLQRWSARRIIAVGLILCVLIAAAAQWVRKAVHVGPEQQHFQRVARWDAIEATGCLTLAAAVDQPPCEFGAKPGKATVVLFGDSHAAQWFTPLEQLARKHQWHMVALTKAACPSVDVPVTVYTTLADYRECTIWRERMFQRIEAMKPGVVLLASSSGYRIAEDRWQAGLARTVERLQRTGAQVAYVQDTPAPGFNVPSCHARAVWRGSSADRTCTYLRADEEARIASLVLAETAAMRERNALFVDLSPAICADAVCRTARDGLVMFKDRNHLSEEFALSLAPQLEVPLLRLLAAPSVNAGLVLPEPAASAAAAAR